MAGERGVRGVEPYRLVDVPGPVPDRPVAAPHEVAAALGDEMTALVEGREPGIADQPHRADWDPEARTMRVRYGDGVEIDVVVQVNESVPPGRAVVVRPPLESLEGGGWRQTEPAGVVLSPHLPADPAARLPHVQETLGGAWRTLHGEVGDHLRVPARTADGPPPPDGVPRPDGPPPPDGPRPPDSGPRPSDSGLRPPDDGLRSPDSGLRPPDDGLRPPDDGPVPPADGPPPVREAPRPDALRALEQPAHPDVPVRDAEAVGRHEAAPAQPPRPPDMTSETVRQTLTGRGPEQLARWSGEHLATRTDDGTLRPRPDAEIDATVARLADQAVDRVTPRADPDGEPAGRGTPRTTDRPDLVSGPRHNDSPIEGTAHVPDGRAPHLPDASVRELREAAGGVLARDFADGAVQYVLPDGPYVRVEMADGSAQHFLPRVGEGMADVAETVVRAGTPEDPHVVVVNHRTAPDQLARVWVHEITETLAMRHAADTRPQPHGLARRAMAAIGRLFGGDRTPEAPRVDPHTAARLNERLHLQRLHDWAHGRPGEQARLRQEIHGVERDLAALGHPVEPVRSLFDGLPEPPAIRDGLIGARPDVRPAPEAVPPEAGTAPDAVPPRDPEPAVRPDPDQSAHWADPAWERENRPPSLDELIPLTDAEAVRFADRVEAEFRRQLEGRDYNGFTVRFEDWDPHRITVERNSVTLRLRVHDENGYAGQTTRVFTRDADGSLYVTHSRINLSEHAQGRGFARAWNSHLEGWYRYSGVDHVEVHAVDRGAYAWARDGYDWAPDTEHRADTILDKLRAGVRTIDEHLDQLAQWQRGERPLDVEPLLRRYGADHPDQLAERMRYERDAGRDILDRAARHPFGSRDYPTPHEISRAGSGGRSSRDQMWVGKEALLGGDWKGVKPITDGVVRHPRGEPPADRALTPEAAPRPDRPGEAARFDESRPEPPARSDEALPPEAGPRAPGEPRTPLRDLFPPGEDGLPQWSAAAERAFARELSGRDYAGLDVRVDSVSAQPGHIVAHLSVTHPDRPEPVGRITREFAVDRAGNLEAFHVTLRIDDAYRGQGFARAFNDHLEGWYVESGVTRISLHAASTVGGYAWARDGFGWDVARFGPEEAQRVFARLGDEIDTLRRDMDRLDLADQDGDTAAVRRLLDRYGFDDVGTALLRMPEQLQAGEELLTQYRRTGHGDPDFPTPYEISQAGRADEAGAGATWLGKRTMMGASWHGTREPAFAPEAPLRADADSAATRPDDDTHGPRDDDPATRPSDDPLTRDTERRNDDVLRNGSDVPFTHGSVAHAAALMGIDLDGVGVHLVTHPDEIAHFDARRVSAVTPPEYGGRQIRFGPAAFADAETLARTIAHEYTHVLQLREGREIGKHTLRALEDEAFANEAAALERFRRGFEGWDDVAGGAVLDRGGLGHPDTGRVAGVGEAPRGPDLGGGDAAGRGDRGDSSGAGRGVRDPGGPRVGPYDPGGRTHGPDTGGRGPGPHDLNRPIGGRRSDGPPFDYDPFYRDEHWQRTALDFELRVGVHFFNDPQTLTAAREAVQRLYDALTTIATSGVTDPVLRTQITRDVEMAFFRGDEKAFNSAGQVGLNVRLDALLHDGNVRELMTSFYNAAYFNRASPHTLAKMLLHVIDEGRWEVARGAGVDRVQLRRVQSVLDESLVRAIGDRIEQRFPPDSPRFARDVFATGNVVMRSDRAYRDLLEVTSSQLGRRPRDEAEQLDLASTVERYDQLGAPLGRYERAFVESIVGGRLEPGTRLPWREGYVWHDTGGGIWARSVNRDGYPVLDGVSATTTRMLTGAQLIGLRGADGERFLHALIGWMLPARDHSLFELLRGASIAGVEPVAFRPRSLRPTAIDLYRNLPGIDLHTTRAAIAPDGLLPHEERYAAHARDPHGFSETQHKVQQIADRLWPQLESGRVADADLAQWLDRNGIDPSDPAAVRQLADRLTHPHVMALSVYTRHSHYLINNVITAQMLTGGTSETALRAVHDRRIGSLVDHYLGKLADAEKPLPLPLALRPVLHEGAGHLDSTSALRPAAREWLEATQLQHLAEADARRLQAAGDYDAARAAKTEQERARLAADNARARLDVDLRAVAPRLFEEVRWHADMVYDALMQLPTVGTPDRPVIAYRGDWTTRGWSPIYGNRYFPNGTALSVLSVSRLPEVAVRFMEENPASERKLIAVYRLTGVNARDISVFSSFPEDQEAVLPPGARTRQISDPVLEQQVRDQLPAAWRDRCRVIVLTEVK